jgi:hypothetical protein
VPSERDPWHIGKAAPAGSEGPHRTEHVSTSKLPSPAFTGEQFDILRQAKVRLAASYVRLLVGFFVQSDSGRSPFSDRIDVASTLQAGHSGRV